MKTRNKREDCTQICVPFEIMKNLPIMSFQYSGGSAEYAFTYVSEGCKLLTGYNQEELTNGVKFFNMVHPEDAESFRHLHETTLDRGMTLESTFRLKAKNGNEKRVWVCSRVIDTDSEGLPNSYEGFFADITKQYNIEISKVANHAKYHFIAKISQEIRTPMNAILGMAELGLREDSLKKINDYTNTIKQSGMQLMTVLNDILDYTKIESGEMESTPDEYILSSFIYDIVSIANAQITEKKLKFEINIDPHLPSVIFGDMLKLRQSVLNLLSNAVKFTDSGHVGLSISGKTKNNDLDLFITVSDTGHGIREEDKGCIFTAFTQCDTSTIEGTGLGLTITENFINLMGGSIDMGSIYGVGSIFTISVPQGIRNHEEIGELASILSKTRPYEAQAQTDGKIVSFTAPNAKILIIDDINTNLKVASGLLQPYNVRIDLRISGMDAIEAVKTERYDLILMDHMMPVMNGTEATKCIRKLDKCNTDCKNVPIVALTANAVHGMKKMFLKNGFDDFLPKPIDINNLNEVMEKWIPESKKIPITGHNKKQENKSPDAKIKIPGVNTKKGLEMLGNDIMLYTDILESFHKTGTGLIEKLNANIASADMEMYTVHIHALKTLLASIGADDLSNVAEALELASSKNIAEFVKSGNTKFLAKLEWLLDNIQTALKSITWRKGS